MKRTTHAQEISERFRELVEESGESLSAKHYEELSLLIEAGIDTALVETMEKMAGKLEELGQQIRNDAEFFE